MIRAAVLESRAATEIGVFSNPGRSSESGGSAVFGLAGAIGPNCSRRSYIVTCIFPPDPVDAHASGQRKRGVNPEEERLCFHERDESNQAP
jgi:hypothetical protein